MQQEASADTHVLHPISCACPPSWAAGAALTQLLRELVAAWKVSEPQRQDIHSSGDRDWCCEWVGTNGKQWEHRGSQSIYEAKKHREQVRGNPEQQLEQPPNQGPRMLSANSLLLPSPRAWGWGGGAGGGA